MARPGDRPYGRIILRPPVLVGKADDHRLPGQHAIPRPAQEFRFILFVSPRRQGALSRPTPGQQSQQGFLIHGLSHRQPPDRHPHFRAVAFALQPQLQPPAVVFHHPPVTLPSFHSYYDGLSWHLCIVSACRRSAPGPIVVPHPRTAIPSHTKFLLACRRRGAFCKSIVSTARRGGLPFAPAKGSKTGQRGTGLSPLQTPLTLNCAGYGFRFFSVEKSKSVLRTDAL